MTYTKFTIYSILLVFISILSCSDCNNDVNNNNFVSLMSYIQKESASVSNAQHAIKTFLNSKDIPIGLSCIKSSSSVKENSERQFDITVSKPDNAIDCRVSLERVPFGSKCLAPCGCTGSQKWIQFSVLNKLRRKDPSQWKICRTCQRAFNYSPISIYGGVNGNLLSLFLDNVTILRTSIGVVFVLLSIVLNLPFLVKRLLVSKLLWNAYPRWSRVIHLPFVFQLWGGKILLQYLFSFYIEFEKKIVSSLTDIETNIIEQKLPITTTSTF